MNNQPFVARFWLLAFILLMSVGAEAKSRALPAVLHRTFVYKQSVKGEVYGTSTNVYSRYSLVTERRNPTLFAVPTMYVVARGGREFIGESYSRMVFKGIDQYDAYRQVVVGTFPRYRRTLPTLTHYMTPNLYNVTLIRDHLLSPFHAKNAKCYIYKVVSQTDSTTLITFKSKTNNTQLVNGEAEIDNATGRIISTTLKGEYDMIDFTLTVSMGPEGVASLLPLVCNMQGKFHFLGNVLRFKRHQVYGLGTFLPDSIREKHDRTLMDQLRPDSLNAEERTIYHTYDSIEAAEERARAIARQMEDTTEVKKKKHDFIKEVMWDIVGDNLVNRIKANFGGKDKGTFRIGPLFNPLYFSYSNRKGFVYIFNIQADYNFTPNRYLWTRFRTGYAFKLKQMYFDFPIEFMYNKRRHACLRFELSSGQRIFNSSILDDIRRDTHDDSPRLDSMRLDEFRDTRLLLTNNYDISDNWSVLGGFVYHRRSAVDKKGFKSLGRKYKYHTFAPMLQFQYRPKGWTGPAFTFNWERSFRNMFNSDMEYEKYEVDASLIRKFHRLRSLKFRVGGGAYTLKANNSFFLDYNNFHDEYIPGGWNDDWSGEFQVLNNEYYNSSDYYLRTNTTYESPLMLLSHLPLIGRFMEMERIYVSTLWASELHPYMEYGYGFTNRVFSIGVFVGTKNFRFDRFGVEFDFEIFRKW